MNVINWARWTRRFRTIFVALVVVAVSTTFTLADALVVTKAMTASTIVEIYVDDDEVRVELEIGAADLNSFANVLPDELYQKATGRTIPFDERLRTFLKTDWIISADGQPLPGRIKRIDIGRRVARDAITGEALVQQPADAELVIRLKVYYALEGQPRTLSIQPPLDGETAAATIGFVCYHGGLPVNDFRYLSGKVTLDLDWDDAWYSRFRHPNLRRQFDAPLSAYLYIEPYEVRKEIIVRPQDMKAWLDLELRSDGVIPVDQQDELKERVAEFLSKRNPVTIDGRLVEGRLDRIHFIHRTLRSTGIIEPAVDLDTTSATLGVIFVYPTDQLPKQVSMTWELFSSRIPSIRTVASDEAGGVPSEVTADDPTLVWTNYLKHPTSSQLLKVAVPPLEQAFEIPVVSFICGVVLLIMLVVLGCRFSMGKHIARIAVVAPIVAVGIGVVSLPFGRVTIANPFQEPPPLSETDAKSILSSLLHNVYRSFDSHDDNLIYDRLAKSVSGELLSEVYLETRKSMEVKNQGGLRISVKDVNVTSLASMVGDGTDMSFRCGWRVSGWIGHWGHIHRRANEHVAKVTIADRDGVWKITAMELLDEQPETPKQANESGGQGRGA